MTYIFLIVFLFQNDIQSPENAVLAYFQDQMFNNPKLYNQKCPDNDPDCIFLPPIIDEEFYNEAFLRGFSVHINEYTTKSDLTPYKSAELDTAYFDEELINRMIRIRNAALARSPGMVIRKIPRNTKSKLKVNEPFVPTNLVTYSSLQSKNNVVFVEVNEAISTGQEYYVRINFFTNFNDYFDYDKSFGLEFILDQEYNVIFYRDIG